MRSLVPSILSAQSRFGSTPLHALRNPAGFFAHDEDARLLPGVRNLGSLPSRREWRGLERAHHALGHVGIPQPHNALVLVDADLSLRENTHSRVLATAFALGHKVLVRLGRKGEDEQDQTQEGRWLQDGIFLANWRGI